MARAERKRRERGILAMCRLNELWPKREIKRTLRIRRFEAQFHWSSKHNLWGRFGGGWQLQFGFQWSGRTLIVNLFTFALRFSMRKPDPKGA